MSPAGFISDEEMTQLEGGNSQSASMPGFVSDNDMARHEALYGENAPTYGKVASGVLSSVASAADLPETLLNLPSTAADYILKQFGVEPKYQAPRANLGEKVRAGFDYLTDVKDSTEIDPESYAHKFGEYLPYMVGGGSSLVSDGIWGLGKNTLKKVASTGAQTALVSGGGYGGREIDKAFGGSGVTGEIIGSGVAALAPTVAKKVIDRGIRSINESLVGYNSSAKQRTIGGLDKSGNFTSNIDDVVTEVTKKDLGVKDLEDLGFFDDIKPTDTPNDVSKNLGKFQKRAGEQLGTIVDDLSKTEASLADDVTKINFPEARAYLDDIGLTKPKLAERLHEELDGLEATFTSGKQSIDRLNKIRASWGENTQASYNPAKTAEDKVVDAFNKKTYGDFRRTLDNRAAELGMLKGDPSIVENFKLANKAYSASSMFRQGAFQNARLGAKGRLSKDIFSIRTLAKTGIATAGNFLGIPGLGTLIGGDVVSTIAKDIAPVQSRAALKGARNIANLFDPLSGLASTGARAIDDSIYLPVAKPPTGTPPVMPDIPVTKSDIPIFSVGKTEAASKVENNIIKEAQNSIKRVKGSQDPHALDVDLISESSFADASYQKGRTVVGKRKDNEGWASGGNFADAPEVEVGLKATGDRAKLLESLVTTKRKGERLFSNEEFSALQLAEESSNGLAFKTTNNKKYKPADKATEEFLAAFGRKELNDEQFARVTVGLKSPVRLNDVDVSPHQVPNPPEDWLKFSEGAPLPKESGKIKKGAVSALAGLSLAASYGLKDSNVFEGRKMQNPESKRITAMDLRDAMIKQESRGNKDAVSPKGARGLMQIMPDTAKDIAKELGVKDYDIHDPETNVKFGTYYMDKMLKIFSGDVELALAGYNAGFGKVRSWISRWGNDWSKISSELKKRGSYMETVNYVPEILERLKKAKG